MSHELLNIEFEDADFELCKSDLETLQNRLSFAINISLNEKIGYRRMGKITHAFVEKSIILYRQYPELRVSFIPLDKWENDWAVYQRLLELQIKIKNLESRVADTLTMLGKQNTNAALNFYNNLKKAQKFNVPGTKAFVEDLGSFFKEQRKKPKKTKAVAKSKGKTANLKGKAAKPEDEEAKE